MSQSEVVQGALLWFSGRDPESDAVAIHHRYLACVNVFRGIVECAPGGRNGIRCFSKPINMGVLDHPDAGPTRLEARVNLEEFDPANPNSSGFSAYIAYNGTTKNARSEQFRRITFGTSTYGGSIKMVPELVRRPDVHHARPWNDAPERSYHAGTENVWDRKTVRDIGAIVTDMVIDAERRQYDLVNALRDRSLNPNFADAADVLFPLPATP